MTKGFHTTLLKVQIMELNENAEWPMPDYMRYWKTFRLHSDEDQETAKHLLIRKSWPRSNNITICDLGCGDGLLLEKLIHLSKFTISKVKLLDPDNILLNVACKNIERTNLVGNIETHLKNGEGLDISFWIDVDVILIVHVVYLLAEGSLEIIIKSIPKGIKIYIIFDTPSSIFSSLWKETNEKYYNRSISAYNYCEDLALRKNEFHITKSSVTSHLRDPFREREEVKNSILSLLCYQDIEDMPNEEVSDVQRIVEEHTIGGQVLCESLCYEISKI